jgi:peptidoglycan/LPS O-acetylase OafA/YrhL
LALAALGLAWNFAFPGGWVCGLFIEYWAHFALGACLYFVLCEYPGRLVRTSFLLTAALLGAYCAAHAWPWTGGVEMETIQRSYLELGLLSAVAIVLLLARPLSAPISRSLFWRPIAAMGTVSYSLYLVHQFNLTLVGTVASYVVPTAAPAAVLLVTKVLLHLSIGAIFWYLFERPFLNRPGGCRGPARVATAPGTLAAEEPS